MGRKFIYCPECDDIIEVEFIRGRWICENCGTDLTHLVK